jgi:hypothetical protein
VELSTKKRQERIRVIRIARARRCDDVMADWVSGFGYVIGWGKS